MFLIALKSMKTLCFHNFVILSCRMMHVTASHFQTDFVTDDIRHDEQSNAQML